MTREGTPTWKLQEGEIARLTQERDEALDLLQRVAPRKSAAHPEADYKVIVNDVVAFLLKHGRLEQKPDGGLDWVKP